MTAISDLTLISIKHFVATAGPFVLTTTSAIPVRTVTLRQWRNALKRCHGLNSTSSPFWVGDLLVYGERHLGVKLALAAQYSGLRIGALQQSFDTARSVDRARRRPGVSFEIHSEVARLPPDEQDVWLRVARTECLTLADLRRQLDASTRRRVEHWVAVRCCGVEHQSEVADRLKAAGEVVRLMSMEA